MTDVPPPESEWGPSRVSGAPAITDEILRRLIDAVQDYAIFMLDPEGHVLSWSAGAERVKGWRADEVIGRHFSIFYADEDRATGKPEQELMVANLHERLEDEGWGVRRDGSRFWADVVISAVRDTESGELVGFAQLTRDTTEGRAAAELMALANEELSRTEAVRSQSLATTAPELANPIPRSGGARRA